MATSFGGWSNHTRVWFDFNYWTDATHFYVTVDAYMQLEKGWYSNATRLQEWSGLWGSGSANQAHNFGNEQSVLIVDGATYSVALTDDVQSVWFAATGRNFNGAASHTMWLPVPARVPLAPSAFTVSRVSDGHQALAWTRNGTYQSVVVQRSPDGVAWSEVGRPGANPASFADLTTVANGRFFYRVAAVTVGGQSAWSAVAGPVFTTPAPVGSVSAVKVGADIEVSAAGLPPYAASFTVQASQGGGAFADLQTGVTAFPWLHVSPNPAVTWAYRLVSVQGALSSAPSVASNTVQLLTKPNPPTNLAPNGGVVPAEDDVRFSWTHNPVDTTAQTVYELRYRVGVGAWTTLSGTTASFRDVSLPLNTYEWQVRTKGSHVDWSEWSAAGTVTVVNRPGVAVLDPSATWDHAVLIAEWSWFQAQSRPQSGWEAELLDGDMAVVEALAGSGAATSVTFTSRVSDGGTYTVRVRAATGDVWSGWAQETFAVAYVRPALPFVSGVWDEATGSAGLSCSDGRGPVVDDIVNLFTGIYGSGTWAEVARFNTGDPAPEMVQPEDFRVRDLGNGESVLEIERVAGDVLTEIGRNKFANPNFVSDGTQVQVHENLMTNPNPTDPAIWTVVGLTSSFLSTGAGAYLYVSADGSPDSYIYIYDENVTVTPGQPLTFAAQIWHGPTATGTNMVLYWVNAANSFVGSEAVFVPNNPSRGVWSYVGGIAPAGAVRAVLVLGVLGGAGAEMLVAKCMAVRTLEHVPYFDGYSSNDSDMTVEWVGAVNDSASRAFAPKTRHVTGGYTTQQAGQASALRVPQGRTATFSATAGEVVILTAGKAGQTINGVAGTVGDNRVVGTSTVTLGPGDWLMAGRYASGYTGPQFRGGQDVTPFVAEWVGAADNSESVLYSRTMTSTNCIAGVSTRDGIPAIRIIPTTASNDSTISFAVPAGDARTQSTMLATLHLDEPLTGSLHANSRKVGTQTPVTVSAAAPNVAGETELRIVSGALTSDYVAVIRHGGAQWSGHMWVTRPGLFAGDYTGDYFDGSSGRVVVDGSHMIASWDGTPGESTSLLTMVPELVSIDLERSVDGGATWETMVEGLPGGDTHNLTDWESLSNGVTQYRATGFTVDGASADVMVPVLADSGAVWLSGGVGFAETARLPYNPGVEIDPAVERAVHQYVGNPLPVAYVGEARSRTVRMSGMLVEGDPDVVQVERMTELAQTRSALFMHRDPDGRRVYGVIGSVPMSRTSTPDVWGFSYQLTETRRR